DVIEHPQALHQLGGIVKEGQRLPHRLLEHFMDVEPVVADLKDAALVARAFALVADQLDIGEKLHLHGDRAIALAGLASSAWDIERKMSRGVAAFGGFACGGE